MLAAGKRDVALESYTRRREAARLAIRRKRVEVVARRGQALEGMGKDDEAVVEYRRAIKLAPKGYYLEVELTGRIIDIYRRKQALPQLLAQYEKEWPEGARGHFEWDTLGKLYEETGAQDKAIAALKKAVAKAAWELETQRRLIQLLENSGRDDEALAQYEAVVRAAPGEARFQLELAERYWRRGQEKKALEALERLRGPVSAATPACSSRSRISTRAGAKRTSRSPSTSGSRSSSPTIPAHLVTLGEQYWQKGDKTKARWRSGSASTASGKAERASPSSARSMAEHGNTDRGDRGLSQGDRARRQEPRVLQGPRLACYEQKQELARGARRLGDGARADRHQADRPARAQGRAPPPGRGDPARRQQGAGEAATRSGWQTAFAVAGRHRGRLLPRRVLRAQSRRRASRRPRSRSCASSCPTTHDLADGPREGVPRRSASSTRRSRCCSSSRRSSRRASARSTSRSARSRPRRARTTRRSSGRRRRSRRARAIPTAYERLGERYVEMQRFADAIAAYEKTVKLDPRNARPRSRSPQLYIQTRRADEGDRAAIATCCATSTQRGRDRPRRATRRSISRR